ncbi:hypothetical protein ACVUEX_000662, partial [Escherichia coli]
ADRNRSHWSTSKTPSYTKSVSWQHHRRFLLGIASWTVIHLSAPPKAKTRRSGFLRKPGETDR